MTSSQLPDLLRKLHAELASAETLDPESRALLKTVAQDLSKFESHVSTARSLAVRFEAKHPDVAAVLRELADTLGKAGI